MDHQHVPLPLLEDELHLLLLIMPGLLLHLPFQSADLLFVVSVKDLVVVPEHIPKQLYFQVLFRVQPEPDNLLGVLEQT